MGKPVSHQAKVSDEQHATIDFETRSEVDVRAVGAYKYAQHPSTILLSLAYNLTGDPLDTVLWTPEDGEPEELFDYIAAGGLVEAHNSMFEYCVWHFVCVGKMLWPEAPLEQFRCSMAKAHANAIPGSLDRAGQAMGLDIQKDKRGKDLLKKLSQPQKLTKNNTEKWNNDPVLLQGLYDYNIVDVDSEMMLSSSLDPLPPKEVDVWLLDQRMNWHGVYIDIDAVNSTLAILAQAVKKYEHELKELTGGVVTTANQRDRIIDWCMEQGFGIPGLTKQDVEKALKKRNIPDNVKRVLEIRQLLGKSSTAKYKKMLSQVADDGRVHEVLVYHKAHTGRWGGAGIQVQNLPRPTLDEDPEFLVQLLKTGSLEEVEFWFDNAFEVAASAIRSMIMAPEGKRFIAADFAAIEARGLLWLAEDEEALDIFRRGECIYCEMASAIYQKPYDVIYKGYKAEKFEETKQRKMGKDSVLGLGYQMGAPKFVEQCAGSGTVIDKDFSKEVVTKYRKKFASVPKLWSGLERAAVEAMQRPGKVTQFKRIKYKKQGDFLLCRLPSGRMLHYPFPRLSMKPTSWGEDKLTLVYKTLSDNKWVDTSTYGGKLTENVVQALSRDLMAEALLRLDAAGYTPIMSVHDEAVSEVPEDFGSLEEHIAIMSEVPDWAAGFPIKAEGWVGKRYRK